MKNLFEPTAAAELTDRLGRLRPDTPRLWGKMSVSQAMAHWSARIARFAEAGPAGCTTHPHSFFGRMTPNEWAVLMYKHVDHHLRQFGA